MPRNPANRRFVRAFAVIAALISFAASAPAADEPSQAQILDALRAKRFTRCPQVLCAAVDQRSIEVEISFAYGSAILSPQAIAQLAARSDELGAQAPRQILLVRGHTDGQGGDAYNQRLSERRAAVVKRFLVETFEIPAENVVAVGFGKRELKNPGDPLAAENRRVEVLNMWRGGKDRWR